MKQTYPKLAGRTKAPNEKVFERLRDHESLAWLSQVFDKATSLGAEADAIKRALFYGRGVIQADRNIGYENLSVKLDDKTVDLIHSAIGQLTEACEFIDQIFTHLRGHPLSELNLIEEVGDNQWYHAIAAEALGVTFEDIQERNIEKLRTRYPEKFDEHCALNRDLPAEAVALEPKREHVKSCAPGNEAAEQV